MSENNNPVCLKALFNLNPPFSPHSPCHSRFSYVIPAKAGIQRGVRVAWSFTCEGRVKPDNDKLFLPHPPLSPFPWEGKGEVLPVEG